MCYTAEQAIENKLKRARHYLDWNWEAELLQQLERIREGHQFIGFAHPLLPVMTNEGNGKGQLISWGLIPHWCKDAAQAKTSASQNLNARGESIFEKPSFRGPAKNKRCLIFLESFYEYHSYKKKKYPFRVKRKDGETIVVAGLWEDWVDKDTGEIKRTCTMVTTKANPVMHRIHNTDEPRMIVILNPEEGKEWIKATDDLDSIKKLIKPLPGDQLEAYPVGPIVGKNSVLMTAEFNQPWNYPELVF